MGINTIWPRLLKRCYEQGKDGGDKLELFGLSTGFTDLEQNKLYGLCQEHRKVKYELCKALAPLSQNSATVQYFIRNNLLHCHVHLPICDLWHQLPIIVYNFTELQMQYANSAGYELGEFSMSFGSLYLAKHELANCEKLLTQLAKPW